MEVSRNQRRKMNAEKTSETVTPRVVGLDRKIIQLCRDKKIVSIKDVDLMRLIPGNVMTAERRASRRLAALCKKGLLSRKRVSLDAAANDGTNWLYAYEVV